MSASALAPLGAGARATSFVASPERYTALALFSCVAFLIAGTWLSLAPITDLAAARYGVSSGAVDQVRHHACFARSRFDAPPRPASPPRWRCCFAIYTCPAAP